MGGQKKCGNAFIENLHMLIKMTKQVSFAHFDLGLLEMGSSQDL